MTDKNTQYVSKAGYLYHLPEKHIRDGINDIWIGAIEPLPETKNEVYGYVRAVKQSGVIKVTGQLSGHKIEIHKPGYYNRFESTDESQVEDICGWCGSPQMCKNDKGEWINYRNGWDCSNCGGN